MTNIHMDELAIKAYNAIASAINRLAKAQEAANEIEKRKVTTHSLTTVYLDDEKDETLSQAVEQAYEGLVLDGGIE